MGAKGLDNRITPRDAARTIFVGMTTNRQADEENRVLNPEGLSTGRRLESGPTGNTIIDIAGNFAGAAPLFLLRHMQAVNKLVESCCLFIRPSWPQGGKTGMVA